MVVRKTGRRTGERQLSLLVTGDHLGLYPEQLPHSPDELVRVLGVASGGRGDETRSLDAQLGAHGGVLGGHGQGPGDGLRVEPAGRVDPLSEPNDLHPPHEVDGGSAVRIPFGDEQSQGVGSTVEGSHTGHGLTLADPQRLATLRRSGRVPTSRRASRARRRPGGSLRAPQPGRARRARAGT